MTIHLAGDSTVAPQRAGEEPMSGWGQHLDRFVDEPVRNLAFGGATTGSFIDSGRWTEVINELEVGDVVVIQFGHNDQKDPELQASGGYADNLRGFVTDVRQRGARPILCTSVERRRFEAGRVVPSHGAYPNAVRDLAEELAVPLIDLTVFTTWLYEDLGDEESKRLLSHYTPGEYPAWPEGLQDDTHFSDEGARRVAAFVARALRAISRRDGDLPPAGRKLPR